MGKETKGVRLDADDLERVEQYRERTDADITESEAIRRLLRSGLDAEDVPAVGETTTRRMGLGINLWRGFEAISVAALLWGVYVP